MKNSREPVGALIQAQVLTRMIAALLEAERLKDEAAMAGALPGDFRLAYYFRRGRGAWPELV